MLLIITVVASNADEAPVNGFAPPNKDIHSYSVCLKALSRVPVSGMVRRPELTQKPPLLGQWWLLVGAGFPFFLFIAALAGKVTKKKLTPQAESMLTPLLTRNFLISSIPNITKGASTITGHIPRGGGAVAKK